MEILPAVSHRGAGRCALMSHIARFLPRFPVRGSCRTNKRSSKTLPVVNVAVVETQVNVPVLKIGH